MNDLDDALARAFEDLADRAPHRADLAATARRHVRRRRAMTAAGGTVALVAAATTGLLVLPPEKSQNSADVAVTEAPACTGTVTRGVLPEWAQGGFSDPEPVMPYVTSASGNIVAILFGDKLTYPTRPDVSNKVLWVWKTYPSDVPAIRASARLDGTGPAVTTGLPTPAGPSSVNLTGVGCWRVTLTWPGGTDTIDLRATAPG